MKDTDFLNPDEVKKQKEAEAKFNRDKKLRLSDMRVVLSKPEGRRMIWNLLERCGVFTPSFALNTLQMSMNEGQRSIGIALLSDVELAKPGSYTQMFTEAMAKENSSKQKEKENDGNSES